MHSECVLFNLQAKVNVTATHFQDQYSFPLYELRGAHGNLFHTTGKPLSSLKDKYIGGLPWLIRHDSMEVWESLKTWFRFL